MAERSDQFYSFPSTYYSPEYATFSVYPCYTSSSHPESLVPGPASPQSKDTDIGTEHHSAVMYSYSVKIIPPKSKKDFLVLDMHNTTQQFETPLELKKKLQESFANHVPHNFENMQVGYFLQSGRTQKKKWIDSEVDLSAMYSHFRSGDGILLWCDGCDSSPSAVEKPTGKKSKDNDEPSTKRVHHEDEVDKMTMELMRLHGDKYTYPAYKVWARMIKNSQWDKMDDPPPIKMITSGKTAKKDKDSVAEIIAGAAVAVVQALKSPSSPPKVSSSIPQSGISPGKKVNLRQQYLQQLKMIQSLRDDGILTLDEFQNEKDNIIDNLKRLK